MVYELVQKLGRKKREKTSAFEVVDGSVASRGKTYLEIHSSYISFATWTSSSERGGELSLLAAALFLPLTDDFLMKRSLATLRMDLGGAKRRGSSLDRISFR